MGLYKLTAPVFAADYPGGGVMLGFAALLIAIIWVGANWFKKGFERDHEARERFRAEVEGHSEHTE